MDGDAVISDPGQLPCELIVHAVGPIWQDGAHKEKEHLTEAIRKSLELAASRNGSSIAIPALSTGIFGYPTDSATTVITMAVRDYLKHNVHSSIKEVYLCDNSDQSISGFVKAMQTLFGQDNIRLQSGDYRAGNSGFHREPTGEGY